MFFNRKRNPLWSIFVSVSELIAAWGSANYHQTKRSTEELKELLMLNQAKLDELTARLKALEPKIDALEATQSQPVDATALEAEVAAVEAKFAAPAAPTPPADPA